MKAEDAIKILKAVQDSIITTKAEDEAFELAYKVLGARKRAEEWQNA